MLHFRLDQLSVVLYAFAKVIFVGRVVEGVHTIAEQVDLVGGSSLQSLYADVVEHFVLQELLGRQAELVVELKHGLQHLNSL